MTPVPSVYPTFDIVEVAQEASERAGIEFRSGYSLRTARRTMELLFIEWANRGLNLWTIEGPTPVDLIPGVNQYTYPENTVDLIEHVVRTWSGGAAGVGQPSDLPLTRYTVDEYASITNKLAQGRPSVISIRRSVQPYFLLWQVPPATPFYQVVYWRLRRIQPMAAGGTALPAIPWRFVNALIAGIAFYMALKSTDPKALQKVQLLKSEYEEQFGLASDEDRDRASFHFVPMNYSPITGAG